MDGAEEETEKGAVPPIETELPPFAALTKKPPLELLAFHMVNIIYGYAFIMRLYNGEPEDEIVEALSVAFDLCEALHSTKPNLISLDAAVHTALSFAAQVRSFSLMNRSFRVVVSSNSHRFP